MPMLLVDNQQMYEFDNYRLDKVKRILFKDGEVVRLSPKAFDALLLLVENSGHVVEKDFLIKRLWPNTFVEEINLMVQISSLRKALGEKKDEHRYIVTIPKRGYSFVGNVRKQPAVEEQPPLTKNKRLPSTAITSLAVLAFQSVGPQSAENYLGSGIADALITRLSRLEQITVRSSSAIFKYLNPTNDPLTAGLKLNVDALLVGTILQSDSRIRLKIQLIRTQDGVILWADKFDEDFTDIFAVEDRISEQVVEALKLKLSDDDKRQLINKATRNPYAYQLYIKGRYFCEKRKESEIKKAINCFREAIALDSTYAPAYAGLADAYLLLGEYLFLSPRETFPLAKEMAQKALELDPLLAEAHAALGDIKYFYDWNAVEAEKEYKRAIEIKPNYATAHMYYGWFLMIQGRFEEAMSEFLKAQMLDPFSMTVKASLAVLHYVKQEYDQAIEALREVKEMDPNLAHAHNYLGLALAKKGRYEDAIVEFKATLSEHKQQGLALLGYTYAISGNRKEAQRVLNQLKNMSKQRYVSPSTLAAIFSGLGDTDSAFEALSQAFEERSARLPFMKVDPTIHNLRADARFQKFLHAISLNKLP
jgi:DNA-binding winged helix-turn-helix (wHTH) protein/tetratricopeptide (TPR) repeat protein